MQESTVELHCLFDVSNISGIFHTALANDAFTEADQLGEHWQMIWCESGSREYTANGRRLLLMPGSVVFFPPHTRRQAAGQGSVCLLHYMNFTCRGEAIWHLALRVLPLREEELTPLRAVLLQGETLFAWPGELCGAPMRVTRPPAPEEVSLLKLKLESLLMRIDEAHPMPVSLDRAPAPHRRAADAELFRQACSRMEQQLGTPFSAAQLAGALHVSLSTLKRVFRGQCGRGITEQYNALRIERARALLREGGATVSEIAAQLGYSSPFYFSRAFKAATGLAPTEFARGGSPDR